MVLKDVALKLSIVLALVALSGCDNKQESSVRYKMTVVVNDNGQLTRASSVRDDVVATWNSLDAGSMGGGATVGDAIVVPVRGRLLVVTLRPWSMLKEREHLRPPRRRLDALARQVGLMA